jgi:hypothetical protein
MRKRVILTAMAAWLSIGCASNTSAGDASSRPRSVSRDLIAESEITARASDAANAFQIVQKLRPQMLTGRGLASPSDATGESTRPRVYVDNISYGDLASLENVMANQVKEIRFVNSRDATTQWGTGHMGGVILVVTKKN